MNAFIEHEEVYVKHLQVVYLDDKGVSVKKISEITGYSARTVSTYCHKYADLLDEAKECFRTECNLQYDETQIKYPNGTEQAYLMKFYGTEDELIFSKIGTTTRNAITRAKEHIRYYTEHGFEINRVTIEKVEDCGNYPAEMVESFLRFAFIKKYPNTWKKNDRFFGVDIDLDDFIAQVAKCME